MRWNYRTLEEAIRTVEKRTKLSLRMELCDIDSACGRVLARTVRAGVSVPPWNRSAVDGYAVRSSDLNKRGAKTLRLDGSVHAGEVSGIKVRKGACVAIATGAPVPEGADAVVMMEFAEVRGDSVAISGDVEKWENISRMGVDIVRGSVVAEKGKRLTAGMIGSLASQGIRDVPVMKRPEVAIIPGGDEIAPHGSEARQGQIYDVNSHVVAAVVSDAGGTPSIHDPVGDTPGDVDSALSWGLKKDICVFVSGSSVGERDLTASAIAGSGRLLFHGVRMRPGRPTMFGIVDGKPVFGLPGYPVSSFVGAHLLLRRCIMRMTGEHPSNNNVVRTAYRGRESAAPGFMSIIPVRVTANGAYPVFKESGAITSIAAASGLVMLGAGKRIRNGQVVEVRLL